MKVPEKETPDVHLTPIDWLIFFIVLAVFGGIIYLFVLMLFSISWWWFYLFAFFSMILIDLCAVAVICDYLRNADLVRNIATSNIRSAAQGYVEIIGRMRPWPEDAMDGTQAELSKAWHKYIKLWQGWSAVGASRLPVPPNPLVLEQDGSHCFVRTDQADFDLINLDTVNDLVEVSLTQADFYAMGLFKTVRSNTDIYADDILEELKNHSGYDANRTISDQLPNDIKSDSGLARLLDHREQWWVFCRANEGIGPADDLSGFVLLHTLGPYSAVKLPLVLSNHPQQRLVKELRSVAVGGFFVTLGAISLTWYLWTLVSGKPP